MAEPEQVTVTEGAPAPDFTLTATNGQSVSLRDLRGKNVVLYFYPKDNTPGCTREAEAFRDLHGQFEGADTVVLGVSRDSVQSHEGFASKLGLPFLLLSDPDGKVASLYGVLKEKVRYGKPSVGIERSTFVIDRQGTVRKAYRNVKVDGHAEAVLDFIRNHLQ